MHDTVMDRRGYARSLRIVALLVNDPRLLLTEMNAKCFRMEQHTPHTVIFEGFGVIPKPL